VNRSAKTSQDFIVLASAPNSAQAFRKDMARFRDAGGVIPCDAAFVADYLAAHAATHKVSTLQRWLASISKAHQQHHSEHPSKPFENPCRSSRVRDTLRGIKNQHGAKRRKVAPALSDEVIAMVRKLPAGLAGQRDRALLLLGFAGALRRSELAKLTIEQVSLDKRGMYLALGKTKADQAAENDVIAIPVAVKRKAYCPVAAYRDWIHAAKIKAGPAFRRISKSGNVHPTDALNNASIAKIVKACARRAGLDASLYSGHSLRAGLATSAAMEQKPYHKIKAQTRHKSDSTLLGYIRDGQLFHDNAADLL
jgi:integrase